MNDETTDETIEEYTVIEEPIEADTETFEESFIPSYDDGALLEAIQTLNDTMIWNFAILVFMVCLLFFILFFVSLQAGKS